MGVEDKSVLDSDPEGEHQRRMAQLQEALKEPDLIALLKLFEEMYAVSGNQIEVSAQMGEGVFSKIMRGAHREFKAEHVENLIKDLQVQGVIKDPDEALLWDCALRTASLVHNLSYKTLEPRLRRVGDPKEREEILAKLLSELYPALIRAYEQLEGRIPALAPISLFTARQILKKWGWIRVPDRFELKRVEDDRYFIINYDLFSPKLTDLGPGLRIEDTGCGTYTIHRQPALPLVEAPEVPGEDKPDRRQAVRTARYIEPELVRVGAGSFWMGSEAGDREAWSGEHPIHQVDLAEYWIGRFPVTNLEYQLFLEANPGHSKPFDWKGFFFPSGKDDHPVRDVSWNDAVVYCRWLAKMTGKDYRLPSEAEWEKAARGKQGQIYPWGNTWREGLANTYEYWQHLGKVEAFLGGTEASTTPVGKFSPQGDSPYGCADMAGNVWEWTSSLYKPYRYDPHDGRENPHADGSRVLRGGSFRYYRRSARCASRGGGGPDGLDGYLGFRVVVSLSNSGL
jgi:formylglycine-generating enzyme required for sulfatase activity